MLPKSFYLCFLALEMPDLGWPELSRLSQLSDLELEALGDLFSLPRGWIKNAEDWFERQSREGRLTWCLARDYPQDLFKLEKPPLFLFSKGVDFSAPARRLSVVGAREVLPEVVRWMDVELSEFLKHNRCVILSGGARGVDQKAHFLAARNRTPTWVFLPSGLDIPYPRDWLKWKEAFLEIGGGFISEYPAGTEMRKHHFIRRNHLIVALSQGCFIVQGARRSGSLLTAKLAQESGVPLAALPGFPQVTKTLGCLDLIAEGATLIRDHNDLKIWSGFIRSGLSAET